jgi:Holliday junction resolvase-like predicted endonuclease
MMGKLVRAAKAFLDELQKPETYVKGDEFEHYVRKHLFTREEYDLVAQTHDYKTNENDFVESSKDPDFKFRSRRSSREFFVEVKYRSGFRQGAVEWCKPYQLKRYSELARAVPVLVAIGVGGRPGSPEHVYIVPVERIKYRNLPPSFLRYYEVPVGQCFDTDGILSSLQALPSGLVSNTRTVRPPRHPAVQH